MPARHYKITIVANRCKECELCINICPKKILAKGDEYNAKGFRFTRVTRPEDCIGCRLCEHICPDFAIFVEPSEKPEEVIAR